MNREGEGEGAGEGVDVHFHAVQCSVAHSVVKNSGACRVKQNPRLTEHDTCRY